jgi:hypothetical protein
MLVARASPAPKMPRRERHRIYAHQYLGCSVKNKTMRAQSLNDIPVSDGT